MHRATRKVVLQTARNEWKQTMSESAGNFAPGPLMTGKHSLIIGVANDRSIA